MNPSTAASVIEEGFQNLKKWEDYAAEQEALDIEREEAELIIMTEEEWGLA